MASELLMVKIRQCIKDLNALAEIIARSEENEKKYAEIKLLIAGVWKELTAAYPREEEVENACIKLKDAAQEYNDAGDNLQVKKSASGFASRIGTVKPVNYKEFCDALKQEDKNHSIDSLTKVATQSPDELAEMARQAYLNKRYQEAVNYAVQAIQGGNVWAYLLLGICHEDGLGLPKNARKAYDTYLEGANKGNLDCQYQLYWMLWDGIGVTPNRGQAIVWLERAAKGQLPEAMREWGKYLLNNTSRYSEAYAWLSKAAQAGNEDAKAWVGYCHEKGFGVAKDVRRAKSIYQEGIQKGNKVAQKFYNDLIAAEKAEAERRRVAKKLEDERKRQRRKKRWKRFWRWFWTLLFLAIAGYFAKNWYTGWQEEQDVPHSYVFADNLFIRSSMSAETDQNQIGTLPYGTELRVYSNDSTWAYVKAGKLKGYVSADYLLSSEDFALLDSAWGNEDAKEIVETSKCRLALLDFLKTKGMTTGSDGWQLYARPKEIKPNAVLFPRLNNGYDKFTEFAFILKSHVNNSRVLAVYGFKDDETPVFLHSEKAPDEGYLKSISYTRWNDKYRVTYSTDTPSRSAEPKRETPRKETPQQETVTRQPATTRPAAAETADDEPPITLTSVVFANMDYDRNVLTDFGQQLYSDMQYLQAKIYYKKKVSMTRTVTLRIKIIQPNGTLLRGSSSPADCTFTETVKFPGTTGYYVVHGWGNKEGNAYMPGRYRYEIWCEGFRLYAANIQVLAR